jgi:hypothetical protein
VTKKGTTEVLPFFVLRGVPNDAELEPSGGVPHGLGGATEDGGVIAGR